MESLKIIYNDGNTQGQMEVHMNIFFPCSQSDFRQLLKVINLDWKNRENHIENLKVHFQKRIVELSKLREENAKVYFDNKQKAADTQMMIDYRKYPNGLPISKDILKQLKTDLAKYKRLANEALTDANQNLRSKRKFEKYLETLETL